MGQIHGHSRLPIACAIDEPALAGRIEHGIDQLGRALMTDESHKRDPEVAGLLRAANEGIQAAGGAKELVRIARQAAETLREFNKVIPPERRHEQARLAMQYWDDIAADAGLAAVLAQLTTAEKSDAAGHLLDRHGEQVLRDRRFMGEFSQTLALFSGRAGTSTALERAELTSRHVLPPGARPLLDQFEPENVAAVRIYEAEVLAALQEDFARDGNPLHAWEAFALTAGDEQPVPVWVRQYLLAGAAKLETVRREAEAGKAIGKEAVCAGKALGFGISGPGRGSWFSAKATLSCDRTYYRAVKVELEKGTKRYIAWQNVAEKCGTSSSTVQRAYKRVAHLVGEVGADGVAPSEGAPS